MNKVDRGIFAVIMGIVTMMIVAIATHPVNVSLRKEGWKAQKKRSQYMNIAATKRI